MLKGYDHVVPLNAIDYQEEYVTWIMGLDCPLRWVGGEIVLPTVTRSVL